MDDVTDPMTPLTDESVDLVAEIHALYCEASAVRTRAWSPQVMAHQVEGLVADRLRAVEAAAARRAIEGSGVVEALRVLVEAIDYCHSTRHLRHSDGNRGANCYCSVNVAMDDARAALSRPEEPRVERCAFEGCGAERVNWRHLRCAQSEPDPCPDPCPAMDGGCHPFTPEVR